MSAEHTEQTTTEPMGYATAIAYVAQMNTYDRIVNGELRGGKRVRRADLSRETKLNAFAQIGRISDMLAASGYVVTCDPDTQYYRLTATPRLCAWPRGARLS